MLIQLQKAAKLLDKGAVRVTKFLWRYPTARVSLLCYLVHNFLFLLNNKLTSTDPCVICQFGECFLLTKILINAGLRSSLFDVSITSTPGMIIGQINLPFCCIHYDSNFWLSMVNNLFWLTGVTLHSQAQADRFSTIEVAESMGLSNSALP